MKNLSLAIALALQSGVALHAHEFLLHAPPFVSEEKLEQLVKNTTLEMKWVGKSTSCEASVNFTYKSNRTSMTISYSPTIILNVHPRALSRFQKSISKDAVSLTFSLPTVRPQIHFPGVYETMVPALQPDTNSSESSYEPIAEPLIVEGKPQLLSISTIASYLLNKNVAFYTGAGLSAGVVPTMNDLHKSFGLIEENKEQFKNMLERMANNPEHYAFIMHDFYDACLYGKPTAAHKAITAMALAHDWGIVTENLDLLHQRTGVEPIGRLSIKDQVSAQDLQKIDYIVTVGLACDDGLLSLYKKSNPQGIIIAINTEQPNYVSNQDILVKQDVQYALPELQNQLQNLSKKAV